ncbi:hypothetical protein R1flu_015583 [Riccia fluitans]|uniref:cysteine--tRNA ligase n=1 Tax=Riccia fluitans TaxID=41844 RepID=A0ABD1YMG7_9MARC
MLLWKGGRNSSITMSLRQGILVTQRAVGISPSSSTWRALPLASSVSSFQGYGKWMTGIGAGVCFRRRRRRNWIGICGGETARVLGLSRALTLATEKQETIGERSKKGKDADSQTELRLYNTMTRQKEIFRPLIPGKVSMYVCGVTSYDFSHIGHARVYVAFDVLFRYLKILGYEVTYVRNFTDIDDKIINRAKETGEDPISLSARFCDEFHVDMEALRCLPPTKEPKVTGHIKQIIEMIQKIIDNGHAYTMEGGDVYFSVESFPSYGRFSGRSQEENRAGERVAVDSRKRNAADFALWKSAKPGEISWPSPWGPGRPGWHIECSAMSAEHLGHSFDIHGGGMDLIFPHHENEIAQSCAACAESNVNYWVHNGFVTIDAEKMSKSLGNFFTIREVLDQFSPLALRWFLIGTQYRSPVNYSKRQLEVASDRIYYLYQTLADSVEFLNDTSSESQPASKEVQDCVKAMKSTFFTAMSDDLLTPVAVAAFSEPLKLMNDLLHTKKGRKDKSRVASLRLLKDEVQALLHVLGLSMSSYEEVLNDIKRLALQRAGLTAEDLMVQVEERAAARAAKDWERSDTIRKNLAALGINLMDGGDGTQWRPAAVVEEESMLVK